MTCLGHLVSKCQSWKFWTGFLTLISTLLHSYEARNSHSEKWGRLSNGHPSTFSLPQNHQQQQQHTTPGKINSNLHSLTLAFPSFKNFLYSSLKTMNRKLLKIYSYLKLLILCLMSHKCYLGHWHSWATEYNCGISWLYSFLIYVLYHFLP